MIINSSIADRLLNAFPSAVYGLPALMQLSEIVESTTVPTAAVECSARPRMLINPEFVARHAETPEKLVMLVMHELHHIILGHTRLFPRATMLDNLVFDAVINSMLCGLIRERASRALFVDFYDHAKFPACLLRPPPGWHPFTDGTTAEALASPKMRHLAELHRRLYTREGVTCQELREALAPCAAECQSATLLGDHRPLGAGSSSDGDLETKSAELLQQLREIVCGWPLSTLTNIACTLGHFIESVRVEVRPPGRRSQLVRLLRSVAGPRGTAKHSILTERMRHVESPIPQFDRRTTVLLGLGQRPTLYRHEIKSTRRSPGGERVHVYLDVSGSMSQVISSLYRAAIDCEHFVHPKVHLFSTQVADVTIADLRRGVCSTTGGTSIECVAHHVRENRVRRAVLVTDGYVGAPSASARGVLEGCLLGVALLGPTSRRADLGDLVDNWLDLAGEQS